MQFWVTGIELAYATVTVGRVFLLCELSKPYKKTNVSEVCHAKTRIHTFKID